MPSCYSAPNGVTKSGKQRFKPDRKKYLYNIDTLWLNADSPNYEQVMEDGLLDRLADGRNYLLDNADHDYIDLNIMGYNNPLKFKIYPGDPPAYQYSIRNDDIAIYFAKTRKDNQMPMRIQINQFILWEKGVDQAFLESLCVIAALGMVPGQTKLNRVDFAVHSDQWNWNLKDLQTFEYPRNIADDNKPNFWRLDPVTGDFETVCYGSRERCQLRIYNKSKEILKKKKFYFLDMYKKYDMNPENVWNVEIEVRRPFIKECKDYHGKNLFDDFELVLKENRLSDLWSFLMKMYHHPSSHWTTISAGSPYSSFYKLDGYELVRIKDIDSNFDREVAQIAGRLRLAVIGEENYSLDYAIKKFKERYQELEVNQKDKDWLKEVEKKKLSLHNNYINNMTVAKKKESSRLEDSQVSKYDHISL